MATKTNICNMALTHIGAKNTVANIDTDQSQEAKHCKVFYEEALRYVLADVDWNFATARVNLSELDEDDPVDWDYVYVYPSDCVKAREIYDSTRHIKCDPIPFEVNLNADRTVKAIFTDQYQAKLRYTTYVDDPGLYPPGFVILLSYYLAHLIAWPITKKKSVQDTAKKDYMEAKMLADVADAEEAADHELPDSEFITARN